MDLDARARQKAIERFLPRFHQNPHLLLFLNFESRLIDEIPLERYQFAKWLSEDVDKNYFHQQIIRAIANMGNNIGALVLAEGVESKEEALGYLKRGISLFQGFYFATPSQESCALSELHDKIERVGEARWRLRFALSFKGARSSFTRLKRSSPISRISSITPPKNRGKRDFWLPLGSL